MHHPLLLRRLWTLPLTVAVCSALQPRIALSEERVPNGRVVVFDIQEDGVSGSDVVQLPDLIEQLVAGHDGFEAVRSEDMHRVLLAKEKTEANCALSEACRREVTRELHADLMLFGSVVKRERSFVLYLSVTPLSGTVPSAKTSEPMKYLKSLPTNVRICLQRLFHWKNAGAVQVAGPGGEAIPPIDGAMSPEPAILAKPAVVAVLPLELARELPHLSEAARKLIPSLGDVLRAQVASHRGYELLEAKRVERALQARALHQPDCIKFEGCLREVASDLHADQLLAERLEPFGAGFALETMLVDTRDPVQTRHSTKRMSVLDNLAALTLRSLDEVFQFVAASAPMAAPPPPAKPAPAAAPASDEAGPRRLMVLDLTSRDVGPAVLAPLPALIASRIAVRGTYEVASTDDVRRLVQAQEQKQLVGCEGDTACLVEISRKTKADLVVTGSVGKVGQTYVLTLILVDAKAKGSGTDSRATETVSRLEDLPRAVIPCLEKVFRWNPNASVAAFHLPKGARLSFAVFDLKPTGLAPETAQNLTQVLSTEVKGVEGASVVSRDDIAAMLQLEQTKMKAGCDDAQCMAEIGGALGVDRLITGDAGKVSSLYIVNLRLLDVRKGLVENRATESFQGDEEQLVHAVRRAARTLLGLKAEGKGHLAITASQPMATVFIDDDDRGLSPLRYDLNVGRHDVRVSQQGYFDWLGQVYVDPAETTTVWAPLGARPQPWYQKWWTWTAVGVVVAGVAGAVAYIATVPKTFNGTLQWPAASNH